MRLLAEFRGTDMWSNLAPGTGGGVSDRHPISFYTLDYYVDVGITDPEDTPALVAQWLAAQLFSVTAFVMRAVISAFDWAFSVDILGGRRGALAPVGQSAQYLYWSTIVPLLTSAALIFGGWLIAKLLARRFGEAGAGAVRAVCLAAAAFVIVFNVNDTIGRAASLTNDLSSAIVSGSTGAGGSNDVSDRLFDTFIYKPWVVLQFGGLERCTGSRVDDDGFPVPVGPDDPDKRVCRNVLRKGADGYGGYAPRFLSYAPGSEERKAEYEALKSGQAPDDPQFDGYAVDKRDAPAVDMMQAGGAVQRLTFVLILMIGIVGAILLLGLICFAALFVQLALLVMIAITPAMVLVAIFPGAHGIFWGWARLIGKLLIAKVVFGLIISAAVGASAAIMSAGGTRGYLYAFCFQAVLFLGLFIKRKAFAEHLAKRREYDRGENKTKSFVTGAAATAIGTAAAPAVAASSLVSKRLVDKQESKSQKPAVNPEGKSKPAGGKTPDATSPPASAGREHSSSPTTTGDGRRGEVVPSSTPARMPVGTQREEKIEKKEEKSMPTRPFNEDLAKARAQRYDEENSPSPKPRNPVPVPSSPPPVLNGLATSRTFQRDLEQERREQELSRRE